MKNLFQKLHLKIVILAVLVLAAASAFGYGVYRFQKLNNYRIVLENKNSELEQTLKLTNERLDITTQDLAKQLEINNAFSGQINSIASTVSNLDKLSKTDKELLQKYSKVYFLNENYIPSNLIDIDPAFAYEQGKDLKIHTNVSPFLEKLMDAALQNRLSIKIVSAYRSFGEQSTLKSNYKVTYGAGANKFSADQGYSEHQLGTTIDFTTPEVGGTFVNFEKTETYKWLTENAYKYGFVLSYPENNSYYQFEPWHWRFVGVNLAIKLHEENKYFYDLEQREIDLYLISIFE